MDSASRPGEPLDGVAVRVLNDGSRWEVLKRYFDADALSAELCEGLGLPAGAVRVLHRGRWFSAVRIALAA